MGEGYSLISDDGIVWCSAGLAPLDPRRSMAWALVRHNAGPLFHRIHREVGRFLDEKAPKRTEMVVETGFIQAERWARMLGFELEGYMRKYFPNENDGYLYARVR